MLKNDAITGHFCLWIFVYNLAESAIHGLAIWRPLNKDAGHEIGEMKV
jgi:hypothetical protein